MIRSRQSLGQATVEVWARLAVKVLAGTKLLWDSGHIGEVKFVDVAI